MVTMARRIEQLRTEKGLSRPALSAALGLPRMAVEKFETGRQTPTQDQQEKLASFFGVTLQYLRGEFQDKTETETWMNGSLLAEEVPPPAPKPAAKPANPDDGPVYGAFVDIGCGIIAILPIELMSVSRIGHPGERLREGQKILASAVRREMERQGR